MIQTSIITLLIGYLYFPVIAKLVTDWSSDPNYSHGFIVPFLSLYLIYLKWDDIKKSKIIPSNISVLILVLGVLMLVLGNIGAELFTMRFSLIITISGVVLYLLGWEIYNLLLFPILYLVFMIPLPAIIMNSLTFPLQLLASKLSVDLIQLCDIPVYREGNLITLSYTTLEVAEACSGIRSLISLLSIAILVAYFNHKGYLSRSILTLSAIPIAIAANIMRVSGTGILAHLFGEEVAEGFFHSFSGWIIFVIAFILIILESILIKTLSKQVQ